MHVPIFSAQTKAAVGLAQINLEAAKVNLTNKRTELTADVRQKTRESAREDAAKEVARLELQLAQQNVAVFNRSLPKGVESSRGGEGQARGKRKVDGVSGCKFPEAAGAS